MQRRTFRRLRAAAGASHHHCVYVVLLSPEARKDRALRRANPRARNDLPCLYVGMTGLSPVERFSNHKKGLKASALVRKFGVRLMPELYECFNPMPFAAAAIMERELAEDLREQGYAVAGGK